MSPSPWSAGRCSNDHGTNMTNQKPSVKVMVNLGSNSENNLDTGSTHQSIHVTEAAMLAELGTAPCSRRMRLGEDRDPPTAERSRLTMTLPPARPAKWHGSEWRRRSELRQLHDEPASRFPELAVQETVNHDLMNISEGSKTHLHDGAWTHLKLS